MRNDIIYPENTSGGVYAIINKETGKVYIGESWNLKKRAKAHINLLKSGKHYCKELQNDYNNNCVFEIVELLEIPGQFKSEERLRAEDYYISCLRHINVPLYNSEKDKNCKDNFFILSCRIDKKINNIIKITNTRK